MFENNISLQVWNNLRVSKWCQKFHFWLNLSWVTRLAQSGFIHCLVLQHQLYLMPNLFHSTVEWSTSVEVSKLQPDPFSENVAAFSYRSKHTDRKCLKGHRLLTCSASPLFSSTFSSKLYISIFGTHAHCFLVSIQYLFSNPVSRGLCSPIRTCVQRRYTVPSLFLEKSRWTIVMKVLSGSTDLSCTSSPKTWYFSDICYKKTA